MARVDSGLKKQPRKGSLFQQYIYAFPKCVMLTLAKNHLYRTTVRGVLYNNPYISYLL